MIHWVLTGAVAGGAFILSLIIGLVNEVTLGTVFLRAMGGGILFAVLVIVARFLVDRYLPELKEPRKTSGERMPPEGGAEEDRKDSGERINIVVDDEDEIPIADNGDIAASQTGGFQGEEVGQPSAQEPLEGEAGERALEEGEGIPPAEEPGGPEELEKSSSDSSFLEEESPDLPFLGEESGNPFAANLDKDEVLKPPSMVEALGKTYDTEVLAQAVQSVLQKDQEG